MIKLSRKAREERAKYWIDLGKGLQQSAFLALCITSAAALIALPGIAESAKAASIVEVVASLPDKAFWGAFGLLATGIALGSWLVRCGLRDLSVLDGNES